MKKLTILFVLLVACFAITAQVQTDSLTQLREIESQIEKLTDVPSVSNAEYQYFTLTGKFKYSPDYKKLSYVTNGVWRLTGVTSGIVQDFYVDGNNYCLNCEGNIWMIAKSKNTIIVSDYAFNASSLLSGQDTFEKYKESLVFYTKDEDGKWYSDDSRTYLQRIK